MKFSRTQSGQRLYLLAHSRDLAEYKSGEECIIWKDIGRFKLYEF